MDRKDFEAKLKNNPELDKIIAQSLYGKSPVQELPLWDSVIGSALKALPERPQVQEDVQISPEQALSFLQLLQELNKSPSPENGQELPLWMQAVDVPDYYSAYDFIQGGKPSPLESWQKLFEYTAKPVQMNYKDKTPITAEEQRRMKEEVPGLVFLGEGGVDTGTLEGAYEEAIQDALDMEDEDAIKAAEDYNKANDFQAVLEAAKNLMPQSPELKRYQDEQLYRAVNYGIPTDVSQIEAAKQQEEQLQEKAFWNNLNSSRGFDGVKDFVKDFAKGAGDALWNNDYRRGIQTGIEYGLNSFWEGSKKPGEWIFNALNRKERNDITARRQERNKAAAEKVFAQNAIAPVGTSEATTTAKTGKVARRLNNGIPEDARVKWSDVKDAVDELKKEPTEAERYPVSNAFSAIGNAIGTWSFDPKTGSLTKTESNGPSIDDIIAGDAKRRLEGEELEQKRSQANANALLDLMKLQEPRSLGGSTIYDPASGEYHQTESALTQIAKAQLMNQQLSEKQNKAEADARFAAWWGGLSDKERKKYLPWLMAQHRAGIPLDAAFGG